MSLIQEALRRQMEEAAKQQAKPEPLTPGTEPPASGESKMHLAKDAPAVPPVPDDKTAALPPPDITSATEPAKALATVVGVSVAILLFVVALLFGAYYAYRSWSSRGTVDSTGADLVETQQPPTGGVDSAVATGDTGTPTTVGNGPATVVESAGDTAALPPATNAAALPVDAGPTGSVAVVHAGVTSAPAVKPNVPKPAILWPQISVGGYVGGGRSGSVMINGEMLRVGESILGVEVTSIEPRGAGVTLRYKGEQRTLRQGQSTN